MRRISITGSSGSGKTTLALRLAEFYNIPLIHLDKFFWKPNWERTDLDTWREKVYDLAKGDSWVMEGNYGSTFDIRFPRSTQIIHMDFSRYICLFRVLKRRLQTGKTIRPDMPIGCHERIDWNFYKYVWKYPQAFGPKVYEDIKLYNAQDKFLVLKNIEEIKKYLRGISV